MDTGTIVALVISGFALFLSGASVWYTHRADKRANAAEARDQERFAREKEEAEKRSLIDVRVRTHFADFVSGFNHTPTLFINVFNGSPERDISVTHVSVEREGEYVAVLTKKLPAEIGAGREWETLIPAEQLPPGSDEDLLHAARVRLSNGSVIQSEPRTDVPPAGFVPG